MEPASGISTLNNPFEIGVHTQIIKEARANTIADALMSAGHTLQKGDDVVIQVVKDKAVGVMPYSEGKLGKLASIVDGSKLKVFRAEEVYINGESLRFRNVTREYAEEISRAESA